MREMASPIARPGLPTAWCTASSAMPRRTWWRRGSPAYRTTKPPPVACHGSAGAPTGSRRGLTRLADRLEASRCRSSTPWPLLVMSESHPAGRGENPQEADPPWWSRPDREGVDDPFAPPHGAADTAQLPTGYGGSAAGQGAEWIFSGQDTLAQGRPDPPRRRYGAGLLVSCVALALLVGGGAGGVAGYVVADRNQPQVHDQNASLGSAPTGAVDRPPDSVAGIATRLLPSVVMI